MMPITMGLPQNLFDRGIAVRSQSLLLQRRAAP